MQPIFHTFADGPAMVAPYSHAVQVGDWLFVTGQMPIDADGTIPDGIEAQTRLVVSNLQEVMRRCGFGGADVVQARVYLARFEQDYAGMNAAYASHFEAGRRPARTCIGVTALAKGALVEIDFVARRSERERQDTA